MKTYLLYFKYLSEKTPDFLRRKYTRSYLARHLRNFTGFKSVTELIQLCLKCHLSSRTRVCYTANLSSYAQRCAEFLLWVGCCPQEAGCQPTGMARFPSTALQARIWPSKGPHSAKYSVLCH